MTLLTRSVQANVVMSSVGCALRHIFGHQGIHVVGNSAHKASCKHASRNLPNIPARLANDIDDLGSDEEEPDEDDLSDGASDDEDLEEEDESDDDDI